MCRRGSGNVVYYRLSGRGCIKSIRSICQQGWQTGNMEYHQLAWFEMEWYLLCRSWRIWGTGKSSNGKQRFCCQKCGATFILKSRSVKWNKKLFQDYIFGKQTLKQLSEKYGKSKRTIQRHLDQYQEEHPGPRDKYSVVIGVDCTFFGRENGIIVARCPSLKRNLYWKQIVTETRRFTKKPDGILKTLALSSRR